MNKLENKINTKVIVTLGPATNTLEHVEMLKSKEVDFVRINMSHSSLEDLYYFINLSKEANIPFIVDTEGSQVRSGDLDSQSITFDENDEVLLYEKEMQGNKRGFSIRPLQIIKQLREGDLLYVDFDTLVLRISDVDPQSKGYIKATVISSGALGRNKGIVIDPRINRKFNMPTLSDKDIKAIQMGLDNNVKHVAASFIRNGDAVKYVREIAQNKMAVISKVECQDALENLDEIICESDYLLIDRGDLSKEIPIEKIPFVQKIILDRAKSQNTEVFVATNLLESMILNRKPSRAEVHDIINTIVDGASGLTLAAETAIGKYPIGCVNMLKKIINHSNLIINVNEIREKERKFIIDLESKNYLLDNNISSSLVEPHGGQLVNRYNNKELTSSDLNSLEKIQLTNEQQLDAEQIAIGTYSPIEGFMTKTELESVLDNMLLPNNVIWSIPILLDIDNDVAKNINIGDAVALSNESNEICGIIEVEDIYSFDKEIINEKLYNTNDLSHPGVDLINSLKPVFVGGKITIIKMIKRKYDQYNLTPKQTRRLFDEKNWTKIVGFHTRNVIHRAHEFIQLSAKEKGRCDGIFIHPVVGRKKVGDYSSKLIIKSYEIMQKKYYPDNETVFGVFSTYSRYAGEREAIFTALCRKNYGCSHFIMGRDHTGVGNDKRGTHNISTKLPDLGIEIIHYNTVYYSTKYQKYIEGSNSELTVNQKDRMPISGTKARQMLNEQNAPPSWYMRPEISSMIIESLQANEEVFIE